MTRWIICAVSLSPAFGGAMLQQPSSSSAVFHSGTRLVQVEVVVRDKKGPVQGLSKNSFTILDEGKPQAIELFQVSSASGAAQPTATEKPPAPLPAGAVSNRQDSRGQPLHGATVVLLDQLNPAFDLKGYERKGVTNLLRALTATDRIALYSLGADLHVLQDFTDDPQKLVDGLARLDQGLDLMPADLASVAQGMPDPDSIHTGDPFSDGMMRKGIASTIGTEIQVATSIRDNITVKALTRIIQHLSGVSGRKNLVWLQQTPAVPPRVMAMLQQADIVLYPVLIRSVGESGALNGSLFRLNGGDARCEICSVQHAAEALGAATGGAAFTDAMDLTVAVRTAEEDAASAYVLGYYPSEEMLDGRYHRITVRLANKSLAVRYRPGYVATKLAPTVATLSTQAMLDDPLDSTGIGVTALLQPDPDHPGMRRVRMTVDLHDIHLQTKDGTVTGVFEVLAAIPQAHTLSTVRIPLSFPDTMLAKALESGYTVIETGIDAKPGELHIVVRDPGTGAAGSLRVFVPAIQP